MPTGVRRHKIKHNYLNNKDILKEIHKSKTTYCSFVDPDCANYDIIVDDIKKINKKNILEARRLRAERLTKLAHEAAVLATGEKRKVDEFEIKYTKIPQTEVVFRVMTWDHIPLDDAKTKKARAAAKELYDDENETAHTEYDEEDPKHNKYVKVNFPPFQHYRVDEEGTPVLVGKSHWQGDLESGEFCREHGKMTNKLAHMFMKLCERYATRSNWRGYCVDSETEALTQRGWVNENSISTNDIILSFDGSKMAWSSIHSIFKDNYNGLMFKLTSRSIDSLVTPGHKIVTTKGLVKIEHLLESDRVVVLGNEVINTEQHYPDALVELLGWITTEGNYQPKKKIITIYQNAGAYADRIRDCLIALSLEFSESKSSNSENISFAIKRKHWDFITSLLPEKILTMEFILRLTTAQRKLLISTMVDADGHRNGLLMRYTQKNKQHVDMFQALCALSGYKTNSHYVENKTSFGKPTSYYTINVFSQRGNTTNGACIDLHGGKNNDKKTIGKGKQHHPNFPTIPYTGTVWCPETDYGSFLARRNGKVFLTGNTYNDEMRSQALLQLSQIGLQFDESKSQNPFAYYTAAITNSFTRVLNVEKRNQNIRDDILQMNNLNPSYTRQSMSGGGHYDD